MLNEFFLWPWMMGCDEALAPPEDIIEETVGMFMRRYRHTGSDRAC